MSVQTRTPPALTAPQVTLLAALTIAVVYKGAFYRPDQILVAGVLAGTVLLALAHRLQHRDATATARPVRAVVVSLLALGLWAIVRAWMAGDATAGLGVATLVTAIAFVAVAGHHARGPQRRILVQAVALIGTLCALSGWIGFVWRIEPLAIAGDRVWRAAGTLTYENALAGLVAMAALIITDDLVDDHSPAAATVLCLLLTGGAATQSRGGVVALGAGAVLLVAVHGPRTVARVAWRPALGAAVAAGSLLPAVPVTAAARPWSAAAGLGAGVLIAALPVRRRLPVAAGAVLLLLAGTAALVATPAGGLGADDLSVVRGRVSMSSTHRVAQHRTALALLAEHPVQGTGPGRATLRWVDDDGRALRGRFVHNEYLQVAVELGAVGAALLLVALSAIARSVWLGRAARAAPWAGPAAALVAMAVHGALDFVWHLPALGLIAALLAGTATAPRGGADAATAPRSRLPSAPVGQSSRPSTSTCSRRRS